MKRRMMSEEARLRAMISKEVRGLLKESAAPKKSMYSLRVLLEDEGGEELNKLDVSKGPTAALDYLNGPGADPRVRALLNTGRKDGSPDDEAAKVTQTSKRIGDLIPTQVEIELTKSIAYPLSKFDSLKKMVSGGVQKIGKPGNDMIVTSGNLIIDGHHRWSSLFSVGGPDAEIAAIDVSLPEKDAASVLAIVQTAIASTLTGGEKVPKSTAGASNILGSSKDQISSMIQKAAAAGSGEAGPILTDEFLQQCVSDPVVSKHFGIAGKKPEEAKAVIIDKVSDNLASMHQPAEGAPPREDMPQLDQANGGVAGALNNLQKGKVNYKLPFKVLDKGKGDEEKTAAESKSTKGDVVLERWQRLAGLIKG